MAKTGEGGWMDGSRCAYAMDNCLLWLLWDMDV